MVALLASLTPFTVFNLLACRGKVPAAATSAQRAHRRQVVMLRMFLLGPVLLLAVAPGVSSAQLSRDEHDRLRLELRQGLHRPVRVGTLQELGLPARLTASERRLLRRQLREQHGSVGGVGRTHSFQAPDIASRPDTSDRVGGEAPEADMPDRVVPASTAQPDTLRLNSSMLDVQEPVSVSN